MLDAQANGMFGLEGLDVSTTSPGCLPPIRPSVAVAWRGEGVRDRHEGTASTRPTTTFGSWARPKAKVDCRAVRVRRRRGSGRGDWLGTCRVRRVLSAFRLVCPDPIDAQHILIEQDGNFQFLLRRKRIQDIALDGGNRKWLATVNNGVFLLSPDGREQEAHFTAANSPSLQMRSTTSPSTRRVAVFATANGVTSFRARRPPPSRAGECSFAIFPNPWRPEYARSSPLMAWLLAAKCTSWMQEGAVRQLESDGDSSGHAG